MGAVNRYYLITKEAKTSAVCKTNVELMKFHYFNENGLVARKRANDDRIAELVNAGIVPSGWHLAYGTFDDVRVNSVIKLAMQKRVDTIKARVAIKLLIEQCENVESKINEVVGG